MSRTTVVLAVGACVTALGAFFELRADSLATNWQALGDGAWGGTTDPALRHTYQMVGLVGLVFGAALMGMAAWQWLAAEPRDRYPLAGQPA